MWCWVVGGVGIVGTEYLRLTNASCWTHQSIKYSEYSVPIAVPMVSDSSQSSGPSVTGLPAIKLPAWTCDSTMSVPSDESLPEPLVDALRFVWVANYGAGELCLCFSPSHLDLFAAVSACALLVYDIILTSGREVSWPASPSNTSHWLKFGDYLYLEVKLLNLAIARELTSLQGKVVFSENSLSISSVLWGGVSCVSYTFSRLFAMTDCRT